MGDLANQMLDDFKEFTQPDPTPNFLRPGHPDHPTDDKPRRSTPRPKAAPKPKPATKADAKRLTKAGWSASQIKSLTRDEASYHADAGNAPGARFGTKVTKGETT